MLVLLAAQAISKSTQPMDCPEHKWWVAGVPYYDAEAPPRRHLVLSNGPEFISEYTLPATVDHANLYWGQIPFEGRELRLRVYIDHLIDPTGALDNIEVRFCAAVRNGNGVPVRAVRCDSTFAATPESLARQYIEPGRTLAAAHLGQKWQRTSPPGWSVEMPSESDSGDVFDLGMTLRRSPENLHYGNLIAEIDLRSDSEVAGRKLIVRTVARKPGSPIGNCAEEVCADAGSGERGWWPQSDIWVMSDPNAPVDIGAGEKPFAAYFRLCERGGMDWAMFNRLDEKGVPRTNNDADRFGTKNSGLWGVNSLYRVYYRSPEITEGAVRTAVAGLLQNVAAGHVYSGPFDAADSPWQAYAQRSLRVVEPGYLSRRTSTDYDLMDLGIAQSASDRTRYFEYFFANDGASVLPTGWLIRNIISN